MEDELFNYYAYDETKHRKSIKPSIGILKDAHDETKRKKSIEPFIGIKKDR